MSKDTNAPTTPEEIYAVNEQYRASVEAISGDFDLEPEERRERAEAYYDAAVGAQQTLVDKYMAERDQRRKNLTTLLYTGGDDFNAAITRYAASSPDELRQVAKVAERTNNLELRRAVAITAYETGDTELWNGLITGGDTVLTDAYQELLELREPDDDARDLKMLLVKPFDTDGAPGMHDATPTQAAVQERRQKEIDAAALAEHRKSTDKRVQLPLYTRGRRRG